MISQDILPEIISCKDEDDVFIKNEVLKHKERLLYLFFHGLTMKIIKHSMSWQPYEYLFLDSKETLWGELPVVYDFIEMLVICDIIKVNYNKTFFKIIYHKPRDVLQHVNKLIDVIGEDKYKEILKYDDNKLEDYLYNTHPYIKNAYEMDKQLWMGHDDIKDIDMDGLDDITKETLDNKLYRISEYDDFIEVTIRVIKNNNRENNEKIIKIITA